MFNAEHKTHFGQHGYAVVPALFAAGEVERYRDHFMALRRHPHPGDMAGVDTRTKDPLKRYPRMIHMHRWDDVSLRWMLDERLANCLTGLLGREPYAVQTMLYFKPAGARGQALHQDNFYLRAQPGTCVAAWMALDDCDEENGCMQIVPGSNRWPLLCTTKADTSVSFTDVTVPIPEGTPVTPIRMKAGDVLFFNGAVVHGSFPNTSKDRFRRSLIAHYIEGSAEQVSTFYHPAIRMDGRPLELGVSEGGGACGEWIEKDGALALAVAGVETVIRKHE
jgi:phytanoyl-CoA hydroxylase